MTAIAPITITFWADGEPVSYSRDGARFGRTRPQNTAWRYTIAIAYRLAAGTARAHVGPVGIAIEFYGARASCDGDNLSKEVLDALNGIAYEDDRLVCECTWRIADWRPEGGKGKPSKKKGAHITLTLHPVDEAARARAIAARDKARAARLRRARGEQPSAIAAPRARKPRS